MKTKPTKFKVYYYIWGVSLLVLMIASVVLKNEASLLPIVAGVLFIGAAFLRKLKHSVVKIEIVDGVADMLMFDGNCKKFRLEDIIQIRSTSDGLVMTIRDEKEEVHLKKGFVVKNGERTLTNEVSAEDFPYAQFVDKK